MESYDEKQGVCAIRDNESGQRYWARCEPTGRVVNERQQTIEFQKRIQNEDHGKGDIHMDTNLEILSYANGNPNGGAAVDEAARAHMNKSGQRNYAKAIEAVIAHAREEVADDVKEFGNRVRAYMSQWKISEGEARKRVAAHDPRMKIYEQDPFGPVNVVGEVAPPSKADIAVRPWNPPIRETPATTAINNILKNLPRDEDGFITESQATDALRPYEDRLWQASADRMDDYTRAETSIQGMPGFASENYPAAFQAAGRRYPSLFRLWSAMGRVAAATAQALRELIPTLKITD